ncbi:hypothetical protein N752_10930 [Desulforamulus aquiferis]|nr:hypothetical protein N752_10930 [Desulforamulus aquiferis]
MKIGPVIYLGILAQLLMQNMLHGGEYFDCCSSGKTNCSQP